MLDGIDLKPAQRRRFEFIEFHLAWEGEVGRRKLQDQFKISPQQATKDLTAYGELAPENLRYDPRAKAYVPGRKFTPILLRGEASEYLGQLELIASGRKSEEEAWPVELPRFAIATARARIVTADVLRPVLDAIRLGGAIRARYTSMTSGAGAHRRFAPRAIASDTHRWHMRSYDLEKRHWSDIVLTRLSDVQVEDLTDQVPDDTHWSEEVVVILRAASTLTEEKRQALEGEYGMEDGRLEVPVRRAMLFYELRHRGFDPREFGGKEGQSSSFGFEVVNEGDVKRWLER